MIRRILPALIASTAGLILTGCGGDESGDVSDNSPAAAISEAAVK